MTPESNLPDLVVQWSDHGVALPRPQSLQAPYSLSGEEGGGVYGYVVVGRGHVLVM